MKTKHKKQHNMKTTLQKIIFYSLLIITAAIVFGCEEENKLPECIIVVNPGVSAGATQGDTVSIAVRAHDPDGEVAEVSITIDQVTFFTGTQLPYKYMWPTDFIEPKNYTIKATVTDNSNEITTEDLVYTIHGATPTIEFSSDVTDNIAGGDITFTDKSTYEPTSWLWDFGDGNTSTEQNPTHVYTSGGTYSVSLTAINEYGSKTKTKTDYITIVGTTVTDYDNNTYKVVKIGDQYWMAENLKTTRYADGTPLVDGTGAGAIRDDYTKYYFAYDDDESNVDIYGRLYSWTAVMNDEASSNENPSGVQGVCPDGWHVPSKSEWDELVNYLGGAEIAGGKLKATGYDYWKYPNTGATDEFGFNGLPAGIRSSNVFYDLHILTNYWTSSYNDNYSAYSSDLYYRNSVLSIHCYNEPWVGHSIRCVKD